jgi:hypothetical protein
LNILDGHCLDSALRELDTADRARAKGGVGIKDSD